MARPENPYRPPRGTLRPGPPPARFPVFSFLAVLVAPMLIRSFGFQARRWPIVAHLALVGLSAVSAGWLMARHRRRQGRPDPIEGIAVGFAALLFEFMALAVDGGIGRNAESP